MEVSLTRGSYVPKHLETFLVVTARVVLQMDSGQRPVMLDILQFTGHTPPQTMIWIRMSIRPTLENPELKTVAVIV